MIKIVLRILPVVWINNMITAGLKSREKAYKGLIEHLEKLESSLLDEPNSKKKKGKDAPESISILKKDEKKEKILGPVWQRRTPRLKYELLHYLKFFI